MKNRNHIGSALALIALDAPTPTPSGRAKKLASRAAVPAWLRSRTAGAIKLLAVMLLLAVPAVVQAQYTYTTNNGTITITRYDCSGAVVNIPSTITGLPVTSIGDYAFHQCGLTNVTIPNSVNSIGNYVFYYCTSLTHATIGAGVTNMGDYTFYSCTSLTSVTIGNRVTRIGRQAFLSCTSLTSVTIPNSVMGIGPGAFFGCTSLTNVTIPNGVISIGAGAFAGCESLFKVTIPNSVTNIGYAAFDSCTSLTEVYFQGNAPMVDPYVFDGADNATVYYLPGTTGWGPTLSGRPTALWSLPNPLILASGTGFGVQTNGFGFIISWATNIDVVVEASTDLANPSWSPLQTNILTGGSSYFQ